MNEDYLISAMEKEVSNGWALLINEEDAKDIPGIEISPMGVAEHLGIAETGEYVPKRRVTHDFHSQEWRRRSR